MSNICVDPDGKDNGTGGKKGGSLAPEGSGGSAQSAEFSLDTCFKCGDAQCSIEASACDGQSGCREVLECTLGCGDDVGCAANCDTTNVSVEGLQSMVDYLSCTIVACETECTVVLDDGAGTGTGGRTSVGEACSTLDAVRGTCSDESLEECDGSNWVADNCESCGVVNPADVCSRVIVFSLEKKSDDEYISFDGGVSNLDESAASVSATWDLQSGQMGVIQLVTDLSIVVDNVRVAGALEAIDTATVESSDGVSGCQYYISGGALQRDAIYGVDADGFEVVDWNGCWGNYSTYAVGSEPAEVNIISFRTQVATSTSQPTITVTSIDLVGG